eukprot:1191139-Lingulodinium_polyedra.AAC.1
MSWRQHRNSGHSGYKQSQWFNNYRRSRWWMSGYASSQSSVDSAWQVVARVGSEAAGGAFGSVSAR